MEAQKLLIGPASLAAMGSVKTEITGCNPGSSSHVGSFIKGVCDFSGLMHGIKGCLLDVEKDSQDMFIK